MFKSFRFEIIVYSMMSLLYAIISEASVIGLLYFLWSLFQEVDTNTLDMNSQDMDETVNVIVDSASSVGWQKPDAPLIRKEWFLLFVIMLIVVGIALFIFYFLILTKKFSNYLDEIVTGIEEVSIGNFNQSICVKGEDEFAYIAERLNQMTNDIKILMENERSIEKEKNDLITNVAHDLRTPLTSIIGYLGLAKEEVEEERKEKYIAISYDKSKRLEKLINDLFNFTKVTAGEITLNPIDLDMVKFMKQMVEEFYPSLQDAQLECEFTANTEKAVILGDGDLMARAIGNLMSNAIKYGKDGKIIRVKIVKDAGRANLHITNYGEVIPESDLENIFEKFFRVESSRSVETGGTGLGLAIAKRIILMHGGNIKVSSDVAGTVFEISLKLKEEVLMEKINEQTVSEHLT